MPKIALWRVHWCYLPFLNHIPIKFHLYNYFAYAVRPINCNRKFSHIYHTIPLFFYVKIVNKRLVLYKKKINVLLSTPINHHHIQYMYFYICPKNNTMLIYMLWCDVMWRSLLQLENLFFFWRATMVTLNEFGCVRVIRAYTCFCIIVVRYASQGTN